MKAKNYSELRNESKATSRFGRVFGKLVGKQRVLKVVEFSADVFERITGKVVSRGSLNDLMLSERSVEYFWVLRNLNVPVTDSRSRLLDVGCGPSFFPVLMASQGVEVWAVDLEDYKWKTHHIQFIKGDVRTADIQADYFDWVTAISVLEHVGFSQGLLVETDADREAVRSMARFLKPGGKVLATMPYGQEAIMRGWRVYNDTRIERVFADLEIRQRSFFMDREGTWFPASHDEARKVIYSNPNSNCKGIVCLELIR